VLLALEDGNISFDGRHWKPHLSHVVLSAAILCIWPPSAALLLPFAVMGARTKPKRAWKQWRVLLKEKTLRLF
jgi:hypothetical protein